MEVKLQEVVDRAKSNTRRIEDLEHRQQQQEDLIKSVAVMAEKQSEMESNLIEIKNDVKTIKEKPARRWDAIVDKVLMLIITAIVGFILMKLGF